MQFDAPEPLQIEWADLSPDGMQVDLLNNSTSLLQSVSVKFGPFRKAGRPLDVAKLIQIEPASATILEGEFTPVKFSRLPDATKPEAGKYSGSLVALAPGGADFTRHQAVLLVDQDALPDEAEPSTDAMTVEVFRRRWLLDRLDEVLGMDRLRDHYPTPEDIAVRLKSSREVTAPTGEIGTIDRGGIRGAISVLAAGVLPERDETGHRQLGLTFQPLLSEAGEYKGELDLLPDDDAGTLTLSVAHTDAPTLPFLVALLAALVGVAALRFIEFVVPSRRIRKRMVSIRTRYNGVYKRFPRSHGAGCTKYGLREPLEKECEDIDARLSELAASAAGKMSAEERKSLIDRLDTVDGHVAAYDKLGRQLKQLDRLVGALETERPVDLPWRFPGAPKIAQAIRAGVLCGKSLEEFTEVAEVRSRVEAASSAATTWQELETAVGAAKQAIDRARVPPTGARKEQLDLLENELRDLHAVLWHNTGIADMEHRRASFRELNDRIVRETTRPVTEQAPESAAGLDAAEPSVGPLSAILLVALRPLSAILPGALQLPTREGPQRRRRFRRRPRVSRRVANGGGPLRRFARFSWRVVTWAPRWVHRIVVRSVGGWLNLAVLILGALVIALLALRPDKLGKGFGSPLNYVVLAVSTLGVAFVGTALITFRDSIPLLKQIRR